MIVLDKLIIDNFLSVENLEYEFQNGLPILIKGINKTDLSQKSNGSGKSAFQSSIQYIISGDISRKVTDKKLVRRGQSEANVTLFLTQTKGNIKYEIGRKVKVKGSSEVYVLKDGERIEVSSVNEYNKWIFENIFEGISKEDLSNYFILSEANYKPFFLRSDREKKEVLSKFSNVDLIDYIPLKIEGDILCESDKVDRVQSKITSKESLIELRGEDIEKANSRDLDEELKDAKKEINNKISNSEDNIDDYKKNIKNYSIELISKNKELIKFKENLKDLKEDVEGGSEYINEITEEITSLKKEVSKGDIEEEKAEDKKVKGRRKLRATNSVLESNIASEKGKVVCPNCKFEFLLNEDVSLEDIKSSIKTLTKQAKEEEKDLKNFEKKILEISELYQSKRAEVSEKNDEFKKGKKLLDEIQREYDDVESDIQSINKRLKAIKQFTENEEGNIETEESSIKLYEKQLKELIKPNIKKEIKGYNDDIKGYKEDIKDLEVEKKLIEEKVGNSNHWKVNFVNFKNYLINRQLKVIQNLINDRLLEMKSDFKISIEGFKVLANGTVKEKITPIINRGGEEEDYGSLSKGERGRIDMAVVMVLQDLINKSAECGGFDCLSGDEILEGVDYLGIGKLLESMRDLNKTILLTTHNGEEIVYDLTLTLVKEFGITKIQKDE